MTSEPLDRISYADIVKECRTKLERRTPDHSDVFTVDAGHLKIVLEDLTGKPYSTQAYLSGMQRPAEGPEKFKGWSHLKFVN